MKGPPHTPNPNPRISVRSKRKKQIDEDLLLEAILLIAADQLQKPKRRKS